MKKIIYGEVLYGSARTKGVVCKEIRDSKERILYQRLYKVCIRNSYFLEK